MAAENVNSNYYISSLLRKLQSSSTNSVQKALISLSRATRKSENVVKIREEDGIKLLLTFIQSSNKKALDMAVSILANCALEKQSRMEIQQLNGVVLLCNLLASLADTSILSRVARALANLSQDLSIADEILSLDALPKLLVMLKESKDEHLLQNTIRTLRIMGRSEACLKELADSNGVLHFVELLQNGSGNEITSCCLRALLEMTKTDNRVLGEQLQEHNGIEVISQLSYSDDKNITENCINILSAITRHSSIRVSVGTMGGIEAFISQIQSRTSLLLQSVEGICMCCREAVNRNKVRSCGGLEVLLGILRSPEYSQVFDNILAAFVCFTYDELALKRLLACGLISTLVSILQKLLFPEKACAVGGEKYGNDVPSTSHENESAEKETNAASVTSESVLLQIASTTVPSIASTSTVTLPWPRLPEASYPASYSPPTCVSPNLSPELRVSYIPSGSPTFSSQSSPAVYSPSSQHAGCYSPSEWHVEDDFSSECSDGARKQDELHEEDIERERDDVTGLLQEPTETKSDGPTTATCSDINTSVEKAGMVEEEATSSRVTGEDVSSTPARTHSVQDATVSVAVSMGVDETERSDEDRQPSPDEPEGLFIQHATDSVSQRERVPLLPGTNFNEHLHLFLPDENLFSADQPSPRHVGAALRSRRTSGGTPCRVSITSSGISRSPDSSPQSPSYSSGLHGLECKIIFLLSRFGQMPDATDSEALTSPECIQTLLDYLCYGSNPDPRCVRLLSRLAWDRKYFETLVIIMLPGALNRQLVRGLRPSYLLCKQSGGSIGTGDNNVSDPLVLMSDSSIIGTGSHQKLISDNESLHATPCTSPVIGENTTSSEHRSAKELLTDDSNSVLVSQKASSPDVSQTSVTERITSEVTNADRAASNPSSQSSKLQHQEESECLVTAQANTKSLDRTQEIGKSLSSILTTQACTSFGDGILTHLLLRGTQRQKEACALSLPYLCKPMRMKQKLLVSYKGILVILSILCDSTEQADIIRAVDSLTFLVSNSALEMDEKFTVFIGKRLADNKSEKKESRGTSISENHRKPEGGSVIAEASLKTDYVSRDEVDRIAPTTESNWTPPSDEGSTHTTPKRLRDVVKVDNPASKRTRTESSSAEPETISVDCAYNMPHATSFDVVLRVESGESVEAHRSILRAFSEVFEAMLSSDFVEANQPDILVKDLSFPVTLFLVHYAYGCRWSVEPVGENRAHICPVLEGYLSSGRSQCLQKDRFEFDFDFLLDLLACADKFLLSDLKSQCEQLLMYSVSGERVADAYLAAACYNTPRLRVHCLQYVFLGDLDVSCVYRCVVDLLRSQERDRVIEDFKNIALDCCS